MARNKIIISDWGGVVECHAKATYYTYTVSDAWGDIFAKLGAKKPLSSAEIRDAGKMFSINQTKAPEIILAWVRYLLSQAEIPDVSEQMFFYIYAEQMARVHYHENIASYLKSLKERCQLGVLSNLCLLDYSRIDRQMHLSGCDHVWLSYRLGLCKPNPDIYAKAERDCWISPGNILFLDDTTANIEAASQRGWNTHLVTEGDLDGVRQAVERFLGAPPPAECPADGIQTYGWKPVF